MSRKLFEQLANLVTESRNPASMRVDESSVTDILKIINSEDKKIPAIIEKEIPYIAKAVDIVTSTFKKGGRLIYVGAGTSGRLGVLDASECPPTFGTSPEMVQGLIAGGYDALVRSLEGSEDQAPQAVEDLQAKKVEKKDTVCGIAASSRTPYVISALEYAAEIGASTIFVACAPKESIKLKVDVTICPVVGPEVVMGSTRMKAGTAQKLVLNMITTTAMIRLGKVYENMMVDLQMNSKKLEERSKRTLMIITGIDYSQAEKLLLKAEGHVKTAIVMTRSGVDASVAKKALEKSDGFVKQAIRLADREKVQNAG